MTKATLSDYNTAKRDILDESAHLEARLRAMYLIKNDGKTYANAMLLKEASTRTKSVLLEHELYYNLGQFQLTGKPIYATARQEGEESGGDNNKAPCTSSSSSSSNTIIGEGDDLVRFLMGIISATSPKHDSISRHEALEALGAIFANPSKGLANTNTNSGNSGEEGKSLRVEVFEYLDDLAKNERILSVRQSAELARDRLTHADTIKEKYLAKQAYIKKVWTEQQEKYAAADGSSSDDEEEEDEAFIALSDAEKAAYVAHKKADRLCFETKWICPSLVHSYLSVDPSPAFEEEENDTILASYKKYQNLEMARARVAALGRIMRNEAPIDANNNATAAEGEECAEGSSSPPPTGNYSLFDRYRAMFSLRNIGSPEAIEALSQSLNADKSSALYRHEIAFVLGQIEKNSCEAALIHCLNNTKEAGMVRHEAAIAIGGIAQPTGLAALEQHSKDRDAIVADSCIAGLEMHRYWSAFWEKARQAAANE